jgi:phosphoribosylformylglycinamidine synthase
VKNCFAAVQELIDNDLITAGHDRSDGGFLVTILEMAFAGDSPVTLISDQQNINPLAKSSLKGRRGLSCHSANEFNDVV